MIGSRSQVARDRSHVSQNDLGETMERPAGTRSATTFDHVKEAPNGCPQGEREHDQQLSLYPPRPVSPSDNLPQRAMVRQAHHEREGVTRPLTLSLSKGPRPSTGL